MEDKQKLWEKLEEITGYQLLDSELNEILYLVAKMDLQEYIIE